MKKAEAGFQKSRGPGFAGAGGSENKTPGMR
jgi:hypothetical protein